MKKVFALISAVLMLSGCNKTSEMPIIERESTTADSTTIIETTTTSVTEVTVPEYVPNSYMTEAMVPERKYWQTYAIRDGWIYYVENESSPDDWSSRNNFLWRERFDGSESKRIIPESNSLGAFGSFFIEGDTIYYTCTDADNDKICKVKVDGTEHTELYAAYATQIIADPEYTQGYLYFTNWKTFEISRVNVMSGEREIIKNIYELNIFDPCNGSLYSYNTGNEGTSDSLLYRIDNGSDIPVKLSDEMKKRIEDKFLVTYDWIYYSDYTVDDNEEKTLNAIHRIHYDGTGDEIVEGITEFYKKEEERNGSGSIAQTDFIHTKKNDSEYIYYHVNSEDIPTGEEYVSKRITKFMKYSVNNDTAEKIGEITYNVYYMDEHDGTYGYQIPEDDIYKYGNPMYYEVDGDYFYFKNPDPTEYGKVFRVPTDGSGAIEIAIDWS